MLRSYGCRDRRTRLNILLALLVLLMPLMSPAARAQDADEPSRVDYLSLGDFGGGSNPQVNYNPYAPNPLWGAVNWIYEPLMIVDYYSCQPVPWLATDYSWTDPQTLTFTIREGVQWSDGTPFTADDVVFTYQQYKKFPAIDRDQLWAVLNDVTASGNVVTFSFKEPSGAFFTRIVDDWILPQHLWGDVEDPVTFTNEEPVGTGPFMLKSFNPQELVVERNPTYWQADNIRINELRYAKVEEGQVNQLRVAEGQYDWAEVFMPDVEGTFVSNDPENNHYWFPQAGSVSLMMNLTKEPFSDPEFRRGIAYALNRQELSDRAVFGYMPPASQTGLNLPGQQDLLNPDIPDQGFIPYDVDQAKKILTDAGYTYDGDRLLGKDGNPISLTFSVQSGYTDYVQAASILRDQLSAIGIEMDVQASDPGIVDSDRRSGNFDMSFDVFAQGCNSYDNYFSFLGNSDNPTPSGEAATVNWIRWNDAKTAELITELRASTTLEEQTPILHQLQQIMWDQLPFITLWGGPVWFEYRTEKVDNWPTAENPYTHPWNRLIVVTNLVPAGEAPPAEEATPAS